jgi:hypothetical protein
VWLPAWLPRPNRAAGDPLLRRSVCAAGQPAWTQVSRYIGLSVSDCEYPALTCRSGTQRARRAGLGEHLIRRLRQVVQYRLLPSVRWADIPQPSTRDRSCPAAWQQYWQQSRRPSMYSAASGAYYPSSEPRKTARGHDARAARRHQPVRRNRGDLDLTAAVRPRPPGCRTADRPSLPSFVAACYLRPGPVITEPGRASCLAQLRRALPSRCTLLASGMSWAEGEKGTEHVRAVYRAGTPGCGAGAR